MADYACTIGSVHPARDGKVRVRFLLSVEHEGQTYTHGHDGKGGTEYVFPVPDLPAFATPSKPTDAELAKNVEAVAAHWLVQIGARQPPPAEPPTEADPLTVHVSLDDLDDEEETKP